MLWALMAMTAVMVTTIATVMARGEQRQPAPVRKDRDRIRMAR
jgi:hypothetical protein